LSPGRESGVCWRLVAKCLLGKSPFAVYHPSAAFVVSMSA
jgi:hypothetical protein